MSETFFLRGVLVPEGEEGYNTVDVTLADRLIHAVVPAGQGVPPAGATVIDCVDKMLLPGTVNAHTQCGPLPP